MILTVITKQKTFRLYADSHALFYGQTVGLSGSVNSVN